MVHVFGDLGFSAFSMENIPRTCETSIQDHGSGVNVSGQTAHPRASGACSFVVADWREGGEPFCGAPTRPGASYCARHQPVCLVPCQSAEGRLRIATLLEEIDAAPAPPPELALLKETTLPESIPDDAADLRVLLDHPPPAREADEQWD